MSIFSKVGGFLSSNAGGLFSGASTLASGAGSLLSQAQAYKYAKKLQQHQYDLSIQGYKEAPSAQRQGLESANYNPMLALGNVGNGVSVAGGTPVSANAMDVSGLRDAVSQKVQLQNQTAQTEALTDAQYADADLKKAQKATELERLPWVSKREKAEYQKTAMETAKLENDIHYQNEYVNYLKSSLANAREVAEIQASASRYGSDKAYNASTYASNINRDIGHYSNLIKDYQARTERNRKSVGLASFHYDFSHQ